MRLFHQLLHFPKLHGDGAVKKSTCISLFQQQHLENFLCLFQQRHWETSCIYDGLFWVPRCDLGLICTVLLRNILAVTDNFFLKFMGQQFLKSSDRQRLNMYSSHVQFSLIELSSFSGPRFVLNPIRMFEGSFGGATLYQNPHYISPNMVSAVGSHSLWICQARKPTLHFTQYGECCWQLLSLNTPVTLCQNPQYNISPIWWVFGSHSLSINQWLATETHIMFHPTWWVLLAVILSGYVRPENPHYASPNTACAVGSCSLSMHWWLSTETPHYISPTWWVFSSHSLSINQWLSTETHIMFHPTWLVLLGVILSRYTGDCLLKPTLYFTHMVSAVGSHSLLIHQRLSTKTHSMFHPTWRMLLAVILSEYTRPENPHYVSPNMVSAVCSHSLRTHWWFSTETHIIYSSNMVSTVGSHSVLIHQATKPTLYFTNMVSAIGSRSLWTHRWLSTKTHIIFHPTWRALLAVILSKKFQYTRPQLLPHVTSSQTRLVSWCCLVVRHLAGKHPHPSSDIWVNSLLSQKFQIL